MDAESRRAKRTVEVLMTNLPAGEMIACILPASTTPRRFLFGLRFPPWRETQRSLAHPCRMLLMAFNGQAGPGGPRKAKITPPEETSQEAAYLKSLGEKQKQVSIKLVDGEIVN